MVGKIAQSCGHLGLVAVCCVATLSGCAHSINISPSMSAVNAKAAAVSLPIDANVGYFISQQNRQLEVTTPGGGGDNVRYYPYEALELGYREILSKTFRKVSVANADAPSAKEQFDFIIEPTVITNSGSTGFFTWPPTNFSVDITNNIRDSSGKIIASPRVVGIGTADTGERISEHGIAGRRAMEDALIKTQGALLQVGMGKSLQGAASPGVAGVEVKREPSSAEDRLMRLKELKEKGLITGNEYEAARKSILDKL